MTIWYGLNEGDNEYEAVVDTAATTSKEIEIVVNDTAFTDRASVLIAIDNLKNFILRQNYPPA